MENDGVNCRKCNPNYGIYKRTQEIDNHDITHSACQKYTVDSFPGCISLDRETNLKTYPVCHQCRPTL